MSSPGSVHRADELIDGWEAAWSARDPGAFAPLCTADVHYEDPFTPEPLEGGRALGAHAERLWDAFPDARLEPTGERLWNRRFLAAPCKVLGTHRGELGGLPPTGRFVVAHAVFYCELDDGRLHRVRGFCDRWDLAVQLGLLPARGTLSERALLALRGFGFRVGRR